MKNVLALLAIVVAAPAMAMPDVVTWAGRVENDAGAFDGTVAVTFELFDVASVGTALWSESVASAVVVDGDLVHELGTIEALDDALLDRDNLFLQITMNGDVLAPRSALRAVPYALRAHDAELADLATLAEDSARFGGLAPSAFQFRAAASGGLTLAGTEFSIAAGSISTARLADASVTTAKIAAGAVTSTQLGAKSVKTATIDDNAVGSAQITDGTIVADDIAAGAVTGAKLAASSVSGAAIANLGITAGKLAGASVVRGNLTGGATDVRVQPVGCGGGIQQILRNGIVINPISGLRSESTSCKTGVCGVDANNARLVFNRCDGTCGTSTAPVTCLPADYGPVVGFLVFAP